MPRKARLDAPGAVHHIIIRGIERRKIFRSDSDRSDFIKRFAGIVNETDAKAPDGLCRKIQPQIPQARSTFPEPLQIDSLPGRPIPETAGTLHSPEPLARRPC